MKITLDKVHCVHQVIWYSSKGNPIVTWTCIDIDCSNCVGIFCSNYTLTVSSEGRESDLPPVSDCIHGDIVKLERVDGKRFAVREIAIVGKSGTVKL